MEKLYEEFGERIEFIGINLGVRGDMDEFMKKNHLQFPIFYDEGNKISSLFGAKVETNILIDKRGVITYDERGFREDVREYLRKLLE